LVADFDQHPIDGAGGAGADLDNGADLGLDDAGLLEDLAHGAAFHFLCGDGFDRLSRWAARTRKTAGGGEQQ
jgi:hypothetical protein